MYRQGFNKNSQILLFEIIRKTLPPNVGLANVVSELLGLSMNTTYTRLRGEKPLLLEEAVLLCQHFGVSLDLLVANNGAMQIPCNYVPMHDGDTANYPSRIEDLVDKFARLVDSGSDMHVLAATNFPAFHVFMFPDLALFRYFSWCNLFGNDNLSYEEFFEKNRTDEIIAQYEKMVEKFLRIPSTEIWTEGILDTALHFLEYHYEMGHFADAKTTIALCGKLTELMNTMEEWAGIGTKGPNGATFKLYICKIDIGNTFVLFRTAGVLRCWLKLFTMHGLVFTNEVFCGEVESWIFRTLQRATRISGASELERVKFFNARRQKIDALVKKINRQTGNQE